MKKLSLIFLGFIIFFAYGLGVGTYEWFPFQEIRKITNFIEGDSEFIKFKNSKEIKLVYEKPSVEKIKSLRKKINLFLVPKEDNSKISFVEKDINQQIISVNYYGVKVNAILSKTNKKNSECLRIYIQGHRGDPFNFNFHNEILNSSLEKGCDFLSFSMIGIGLNQGPSFYPSRRGKVFLDSFQSTLHRNYSQFFSVENPNLDPLSLFIWPHAKIINEIKNNYTDIKVMGISGGGWYALWLSVLLPEIKTTISYAASLPFVYLKFSRNMSDWENQFSNVYNHISYLDLYYLSSFSSAKLNHRESYLIYNTNDPCCYMNPYAQDFKDKMKYLNFSNLKIIVDESNEHSMNVELVNKILDHLILEN